MSEKLMIQHKCSEHMPESEGAYATDKGDLFWWPEWGCFSSREDRPSNAYPTYWYEDAPPQYLVTFGKRSGKTTLIDALVEMAQEQSTRVMVVGTGDASAIQGLSGSIEYDIADLEVLAAPTRPSIEQAGEPFDDLVRAPKQLSPVHTEEPKPFHERGKYKHRPKKFQ